MLKFVIPAPVEDNWQAWGQSAYGRADLSQTENELVAQKWQALISKRRNIAITCINDSTYGFDFTGRELRLTLLRAAAYCALHCFVGNPKTIVPLDRFTPRMDQGEHIFRFWINAGTIKQRIESIERESIVRNEPPCAFSYFPSGSGKNKTKPLWILDDKVIVGTVLKKAEKGNDLIVRLFEPTGKSRSAVLNLPIFKKKLKMKFGPFEIKTLKIGPTGLVRLVNLLEK